jgi:hypothetical protein
LVTKTVATVAIGYSTGYVVFKLDRQMNDEMDDVFYRKKSWAVKVYRPTLYVLHML